MLVSMTLPKVSFFVPRRGDHRFRFIWIKADNFKINEMRKFGVIEISFFMDLNVTSSFVFIFLPSLLKFLAISCIEVLLIFRKALPERSSSPLAFILET